MIHSFIFSLAPRKRTKRGALPPRPPSKGDAICCEGKPLSAKVLVRFTEPLPLRGESWFPTPCWRRPWKGLIEAGEGHLLRVGGKRCGWTEDVGLDGLSQIGARTKVLGHRHRGGNKKIRSLCNSERHRFWPTACGCNPLAGGGQWVGLKKGPNLFYKIII